MSQKRRKPKQRHPSPRPKLDPLTGLPPVAPVIRRDEQLRRARAKHRQSAR